MPESVFLINLQATPATLLIKRLWHRCIPVNFAKFLRTLFFYRTPPVGRFVHNRLRKNKNNSWYFYTIRIKNFAMAHQKQQIKSATKYIIKGNNRNTRRKCKIGSKLTKKTSQRRQWRRSDVFVVVVVNFEQINVCC